MSKDYNFYLDRIEMMNEDIRKNFNNAFGLKAIVEIDGKTKHFGTVFDNDSLDKSINELIEIARNELEEMMEMRGKQ
jgi:hypothetical protein